MQKHSDIHMANCRQDSVKYIHTHTHMQTTTRFLHTHTLKKTFNTYTEAIICVKQKVPQNISKIFMQINLIVGH